MSFRADRDSKSCEVKLCSINEPHRFEHYRCYILRTTTPRGPVRLGQAQLFRIVRDAQSRFLATTNPDEKPTSRNPLVLVNRTNLRIVSFPSTEGVCQTVFFSKAPPRRGNLFSRRRRSTSMASGNFLIWEVILTACISVTNFGRDAGSHGSIGAVSKLSRAEPLPQTVWADWRPILVGRRSTRLDQISQSTGDFRPDLLTIIEGPWGPLGATGSAARVIGAHKGSLAKLKFPAATPWSGSKAT